MPKKDPQKPSLPTTIPPMRDTPPDEQDGLRERHKIRSDVRDAIKQLEAVLKAWVDDIVMEPERYRTFNGRGHHGEYAMFPEDTLAAKLKSLGWTQQQIASLNTIDTPLDLMTIEELEFVIQRIQAMLNWFAKNPNGGSFQRACAIYQAVGAVVQRAVQQRTGHAPAQFPTPHVIITGEKQEERRLKPAPYRAPLFPPDPAQEEKP